MGAFIGGEAVLLKLCLCLAFSFVLSACMTERRAPTPAKVSGPALVIDGDSLVVGGAGGAPLWCRCL